METEDYFQLSKDGMIAIIFNHYRYSDPKVRVRRGTDVDKNATKACLESLGFKVYVQNESTVDDIRRKLILLSNQPNLKCIAVVILTHGNKNGYLHAYDCCYHKNMLFNIFKNKLNEIPKLFFFQACRGCLIDKGKPAPRGISDDTGQDIIYVPNLICHYSTSEKYVSFRNVFCGSKFIRTLCDSLKQHGKEHDLVSILTLVNYKMAVYFKVKERGEFQDGKQMPQIVNTMKKLIQFPKS